MLLDPLSLSGDDPDLIWMHDILPREGTRPFPALSVPQGTHQILPP
jgi:hypothetical protein